MGGTGIGPALSEVRAPSQMGTTGFEPVTFRV